MGRTDLTAESTRLRREMDRLHAAGATDALRRVQADYWRIQEQIEISNRGQA